MHFENERCALPDGAHHFAPVRQDNDTNATMTEFFSMDGGIYDPASANGTSEIF